MFNKHIAAYTIGKHCLLILDDYGSHATPEFDHFCKKHQIISFYILSYLLH